jgi:hypothetical protein
MAAPEKTDVPQQGKGSDMTVIELRKELEQLETDGRGALPVVVEVGFEGGEYEYCEASVVRTIRADSNHAPDFALGRQLVLVE